MARVFISYKRADKENVFPLKDKIETAIGEPCWIDMDGIESDAQFAEVIMHLELLWAGGDAPNDPHKVGSIYRRDNYYPESQYTLQDLFPEIGADIFYGQDYDHILCTLIDITENE